MIRAVLDTNVYVSAFIGSVNSRSIINLILENRLRVFTSTAILSELREVLLRPKFKLNPAQVTRFVAEVESSADVVEPEKKIINFCRDSGDHIILECVMKSSADYLITGDDDLLVLKQFLGTTIISPADFLGLCRL